MAPGLRIGIDLDEVLAQFVHAFLDFHNHVYGTAYRFEDIFTFNMDEVWDIPKDVLHERFLEFYRSAYFTQIPTVTGAVDAIRALEQAHELFIITARPDRIREETMDWLDHHFPDVFSDEHVHFASNVFANGNHRKGKICQALALDVMVEDNAEYAEECAPHVGTIFLIDSPWNQSESLPENVVRVQGWDQIVQAIQEHEVVSR